MSDRILVERALAASRVNARLSRAGRVRSSIVRLRRCQSTLECLVFPRRLRMLRQVITKQQALPVIDTLTFA